MVVDRDTLVQHDHVDRSWFGDDYTPFKSFVEDLSGNIIPVVGIGSVELPTKTSPFKTGPRSHGTLRLRNVLHAPSIFCNLIGRPIQDDYKLNCGIPKHPSVSSGSITLRSDGRSVAYFKPMYGRVRFWEVRLSGPPVGPRVGPSPFNASARYALLVFWPESESERFAALQASTPRLKTAIRAVVRIAQSSRTTTQAEKAWIKAKFGNEFRFLMVYGLSIYKAEDREEGRHILRALMYDDESRG
ncbi:predicted protein [Aspergillus terreus NIH2624]|uniref:Uncharacterized protein n=1 Tax=Aspergillus terreus (strain NIH 2624 / FGSC A1156) TaxID=341663 RepID=Q0D0W3_ASPTN|nr:uncharacterized protein ATEG_00421 [Aspergillus terreus NIH2624]EAU39067.1 predicted protein [Aspergillus terreus NIH2624]